MSKSLLRATSLVSLNTFISRITGLARDTIVAAIFGATASVDAFYIAFRIPNFLRNLFAEGAFSQAFVPVLSEYRHKSNEEEMKSFISHIAGALSMVMLIITVIGVLAAPIIIHVFAPGLDPFRFGLACHMLRITFPYAMLICLTAFAGSVLNSYGRFGIASLNASLLNVCLIATAFGITHLFTYPVEAQAWGVLLGGFVQLFFLFPFLKRLGFLNWPRFNWRYEGVQRVMKLMVPAVFGASVSQISLLINSIFASFLPAGSVTWLYYSERLAYFPLGVFGVALATVVMPHLSRQHAAQSPATFSVTMDWGIRCNLLLGIPCVLTMAILAGPLVSCLFQYGHFNQHDVIMTRESVLAYAVGLQSFMLAKVLSSGFYATQDIKTPVRINIVSLIANMLFSALLIKPLAHAGIALASSLAAWLNIILLSWYLLKHKIYHLQPGWSTFLTRIIASNTLLSLILWYGSDDLPMWFAWHWYQRFIHLFGLLFIGMIVYLGCLWLSGMRLADLKVQGVNL